MDLDLVIRYFHLIAAMVWIGGMITLQDDAIRALPFGAFTDPETGRPRVRHVNVQSASYQVARKYMLRLEPEDLAEPDRLAPLAAQAGLSPDEFRARYAYLVEPPVADAP